MNLVVFATYGSSLKTWEESGILDRELALYECHANQGAHIHFLSHGNGDDIEIAKRYDFLNVLCNKWNLHPRIYALLTPFLHRHALRNADIYKTNQMYGAHIARRAARLWRKPLLVRQGYGHYEHRVAEFGEESKEARSAFHYEGINLKAANATIFTTRELADRAKDRHKIAAKKVNVIPNYIVPDRWTPAFQVKDGSSTSLQLIFFGRFTEQKNLANLIAALKGTNHTLTLIGDGPLKGQLAKQAEQEGVDCQFFPRMQQPDVRDKLKEADIFVLPSHYEGHPKSLIETMAFGMPILAARSPGVEQLIKDGESGLLAEPDPQGLRKGIERTTQLSLEQRQTMGQRSREWALSKYAVAAVAKTEFALIENLLLHDK